LLTGAWWNLARGERAQEAMEQAQRLVADRGDSPAAARVLAQAARLAAVGCRFEDALRFGAEALRMQQALGIENLVPDPLQALGTGHAMTGDLERGIAELEQVVERATAAGTPEAVRAYNNLAILLWHAGDLDRVEATTLAGMKLAERLGHRIHFLDSHLWWLGFQRGRWDEALAPADDFLAGGGPSGLRYSENTARGVRARIYLARDVPETELEVRRRLELARATGDAQMLVPALSNAAYINRELGRDAEAESASAELLPMLAAGMLTAHVLGWPALVHPSMREGLSDALADAPRTPLVDVARLIAHGDVVAAADRLAEHGDAANAAELRLTAAKHFADEGREDECGALVSKALPFFRSVGATRFIRACEQLVAQPHAAPAPG
jgi:tetratricopeptide (TPR) repeat protein